MEKAYQVRIGTGGSTQELIYHVNANSIDNADKKALAMHYADTGIEESAYYTATSEE